MNTRTIAAPIHGAQLHGSHHQTQGGNRAFELSTLPQQWQRGLLCIGQNKQPVDPCGRPLRDWPTAPVPSLAQLLQAPAVGLRTGRLTNTLCLDFDGAEAWAIFRRLFGGTPAEVLPKTIGWTSGKPHRCQLAFAIAREDQFLLRGKRRKIGSLELRWDGAQSVLLGHHPETGAYHWLDGAEPWRQELATFPTALLRLVPDAGAQARQVTPQVTRQVAGLVVPLEQFITLQSRLLIGHGSAAGQCNDDALRLSLDLVAAEAWLKAQGVGVERSAQELFDDYCRQCPQTINGKPFDERAMQARFDGAVKRCPSPPTPEQKLQERLAYHSRMASRGTSAHSGHQLAAGALMQEVAA